MGTNYYVAKNRCECCNRYDLEYHIGKSSYGWAFSFRGYRAERLVTWQAWREFLREQTIVDEYGDVIDYDWFVDMIQTHKAPGFQRPDGHVNLQHNEQGRIDQRPWFDADYDWDDEDGYAFTSREFS
jgi:hypothetical protein